MAKKKLRVKRQRIRVSRRDWDEAQRMTDRMLASIGNRYPELELPKSIRNVDEVKLSEPTE